MERDGGNDDDVDDDDDNDERRMALLPCLGYSLGPYLSKVLRTLRSSLSDCSSLSIIE